MPEKIRVEFRPKTNLAWQHVQDVSHNPRVRVTVRSDRHLQSLVKYLDQKWKHPKLKLVSFEHYIEHFLVCLKLFYHKT